MVFILYVSPHNTIWYKIKLVGGENMFEQAQNALFEYVEVFYNSGEPELHSAIGFHSPVDFETKLN